MSTTLKQGLARLCRIAAKIALLAALLAISQVAGQEIALPPAQTRSDAYFALEFDYSLPS